MKKKLFLTIISVALLTVQSTFSMQLIEKKPEANTKRAIDPILQKQLFRAVKSNDLQKVRQLLETQEVDVNKTNKFNETPLYWACYRKNLDIVKLLLQKEAQQSVNTYDKYNRTPLYLACIHDNLDIVTLLLPHCSKKIINTPETDFNRTPLHRACSHNNLDMVKLLLQKRAQQSVNTCDKWNQTPLHRACYEDSLKIVKLLLPYCNETTINTCDKFNRTPLFSACAKNNLDIVKLLLQNGATVENKDLTDTRNPKIRNYLQNAYDLQQSEKKLDFVVKQIDEDTQSNSTEEEEEGEVPEKKSSRPTISQKVIDTIRLAFCHSMLTFAKSHEAIEKTLFFRLYVFAKENPKVKDAICIALQTKERQYDHLSDNFIKLCKQIIKNIDLSFAKSKSFQNLLDTYAERKKMRAFTEKKKKPLCDVEIECQK